MKIVLLLNLWLANVASCAVPSPDADLHRAAGGFSLNGRNSAALVWAGPF